MRRTEAVIEHPTFTRPIDTSANTNVRFAGLAARYARSTQFVSSTEGLKSFPSYAEIVRRRSVMLPAIALTLSGRADAIGLALAFEDIQTNLTADGSMQKPVTAGAVTLEEKRARILDWAEDESIIKIRSAEERIKRGVVLFSLMETAIEPTLSAAQLREYQNLPSRYKNYSFDYWRDGGRWDLVSPGGTEIRVAHEISGISLRRFYHSLEFSTTMTSSKLERYSVEITSKDNGAEITDARFSATGTPDTTFAADDRIRNAVMLTFGLR